MENHKDFSQQVAESATQLGRLSHKEFYGDAIKAMESRKRIKATCEAVCLDFYRRGANLCYCSSEDTLHDIDCALFLPTYEIMHIKNLSNRKDEAIQYLWKCLQLDGIASKKRLDDILGDIEIEGVKE